jgi:hypothetical protein
MSAAIIYNVTVKTDISIANAWLQWLTEEHIPEIMQTKCFMGARVVRLLELDDTDGPTYAIQYYAASKADYNRYKELYGPDIRNKFFNRWGETAVVFRTVMEVVQEM